MSTIVLSEAKLYSNPYSCISTGFDLMQNMWPLRCAGDRGKFFACPGGDEGKDKVLTITSDSKYRDCRYAMRLVRDR
jgi:hypothetical protein